MISDFDLYWKLIIIFSILWILLFFLLRKIFFTYNPYNHKELKKTWKSVQTTIIQTYWESVPKQIWIHNKMWISADFWDENYYYVPYLVLQYILDKETKYFYKIYRHNLKNFLALNDIFSKHTLKPLKLWDKLRCYINPNNYKEFYVDPKDIFLNKWKSKKF